MSTQDQVLILAESMGCGVIASDSEIWIGCEDLEVTAGRWEEALPILKAAQSLLETTNPGRCL